MALKRHNDLQAAFSMASMTDVIFLLLIFFMVTSTYVFPTALEVNLPQSNEQTSMKPPFRIYLDAEGSLYSTKSDDNSDFAPISLAELPAWLSLAKADMAVDGVQPTVALYADSEVAYGRIVEVLNIGSALDVKVVLATRPAKNLPMVASTSEEMPVDAASADAVAQ